MFDKPLVNGWTCLAVSFLEGVHLFFGIRPLACINVRMSAVWQKSADLLLHDSLCMSAVWQKRADLLLHDSLCMSAVWQKRADLLLHDSFCMSAVWEMRADLLLHDSFCMSAVWQTRADPLLHNIFCRSAVWQLCLICCFDVWFAVLWCFLLIFWMLLYAMTDFVCTLWRLSFDLLDALVHNDWFCLYVMTTPVWPFGCSCTQWLTLCVRYDDSCLIFWMLLYTMTDSVCTSPSKLLLHVFVYVCAGQWDAAAVDGSQQGRHRPGFDDDGEQGPDWRVGEWRK